MLPNGNLILPDGAAPQVSLQPLIIIGLTNDYRIGVYYPNDQLLKALRNRMSVAELQNMKDNITVALKNSIDKRIPTVINIR